MAMRFTKAQVATLLMVRLDNFLFEDDVDIVTAGNDLIVDMRRIERLE